MNWKITGQITKEVIDEIVEVKEKYGLTAEALLEKAKNEKSSLHNKFEWDNTIAGHRYRLQQARELINDVKVIIIKREVNAFENLNIKPGETIPQRQYVTVQEIKENNDLKEQILKRAKNQIKYWRDMYALYEEFNPIFNVIDEVLKNEIETN